jgi:transcription elongation factor GreA
VSSTWSFRSASRRPWSWGISGRTPSTRPALERQQFVQARIGHLSHRLSELLKIDVDAMPADRVGFGSKVTIRDAELGEEMTFTLVAGDYMDLEGGQVSMASPIGSGLQGAKEGKR